MNEFRIEKTPIAVEVWTTDGDVRGFVHVAPFARSHSGFETVLDLLAAPEPFLPVTRDEGVDLFAKNSILAIRCPPQPEVPGLPVVERYGVVYLRGREAFVATFRGERPPDKSRVIDFLNEDGPYVVTLHAGAQVVLAKQHLVRVVPMASVAMALDEVPAAKRQKAADVKARAKKQPPKKKKKSKR